MVPHILAVIIMGGSILQLGWDRSECRIPYLSCSCGREPIIAIFEFEYMHFQVWVGCAGLFSCR